MKKTKLLLATLISMFAFTCGVKAIEVNTEEEFISAMNSGEDIKLTENIEVNSTITLDKEVELDLNGKEIAFALNKYIYLKGGNLNITGTGTLYEKSPNFSPIIIKGSEKVEDVNYTTLTIGENVTIKGWAGLFIDQNNSKAYGVTVNVNGTTIGMKDTNGDLGSGIYLNGSITDNNNAPVINISSTAKISAEGQGIYAAGYGVWTINKGEVIGDLGIEIRSGELNVNGGTITGIYKPTTVKPNGNGPTTNGAGIAVAQHTTKYAITVNIKGGTIKGFTAFYESNPQKNSATDLEKIKLNITGGTFEAINEGTNTIYSDDFTGFVTGCTSNKKIDTTYVASKHIIKENNGTYTVSENKVLETKDEKVIFESAEAIRNDLALKVTEKTEDEIKKGTEKVTEAYKDNKKVKEVKLINLYEINVLNGDGRVEKLEDGKFTIAIAIPESEQKYDAYKVVYFDEEGKLVETLDAKLENGKVVFTTTHLSTYGVVGYNNVATKNPATNDMNLALILASLGLASAGAVLVSRKKLTKANR